MGLPAKRSGLTKSVNAQITHTVQHPCSACTVYEHPLRGFMSMSGCRGQVSLVAGARSPACRPGEGMDGRPTLLQPRRLRWHRQAWRAQQWWQRRLRSRGPAMLRTATWLCAAVLLLTTLALFTSVVEQQKSGALLCMPPSDPALWE